MKDVFSNEPMYGETTFTYNGGHTQFVTINDLTNKLEDYLNDSSLCVCCMYLSNDFNKQVAFVKAFHEFCDAYYERHEKYPFNEKEILVYLGAYSYNIYSNYFSHDPEFKQNIRKLMKNVGEIVITANPRVQQKVPENYSTVHLHSCATWHIIPLFEDSSLRFISYDEGLGFTASSIRFELFVDTENINGEPSDPTKLDNIMIPLERFEIPESIKYLCVHTCICDYETVGTIYKKPFSFAPNVSLKTLVFPANARKISFGFPINNLTDVWLPVNPIAMIFNSWSGWDQNPRSKTVTVWRSPKNGCDFSSIATTNVIVKDATETSE
jgi:hypothetical protein